MHRFVFTLLFVLMAGVCSAEELQTASYPISLINGAKALPVGTQVWANIGDGPCTYPGGRNTRKSWLPIANKQCFEGEYHKAVITEVFHFRGGPYGEPGWAYKIEYLDLTHPTTNKRLTRDEYVDKAYKFVNLPARFAVWSQYIIRMNW